MGDTYRTDSVGRDRPGVLVHPPILIVCTIGLGLLLEWRAPTALADWRWLGLPLLFAGVLLAGCAMWQFVRAETSIPTFRSASALVTDGPYRWSRNPMYLAAVLIHAGFGLAVDNLWILLLTAPFFAILHWAVIMREERYMAAKFGLVYDRYRREVRRWL